MKILHAINLILNDIRQLLYSVNFSANLIRSVNQSDIYGNVSQTEV